MWEMQALSSTTTGTGQDTNPTNGNSTSDNCMLGCNNNGSTTGNLITNANGACSILNSINAAAFTDSDLNNGQMSQALVTATMSPSAGCTASPSQQSPGSSSSSSSNSVSSQSSQSPPHQQHQQHHSLMNGNGHMEATTMTTTVTPPTAVTTVNGAVVMHHPSIQLNQQQISGHLHALSAGGIHNVMGNGNGHLSMSVQRQNHTHHHHSQQQQQQQQPQTNGNTILSMAANLIAGDLTSVPPPVMDTNHGGGGGGGTVLMDPNGSLIHPALRGVKTVNIGE